MKKKILNVAPIIWISFFLSIPLFIFIPQIDLFFASLFYDGHRFTLDGSWIEGFFYFSVRPLIYIFSFGTLGIFIYNVFAKKSIFNVTKKTLLYVFLVLALAPGLIVNITLKDHWGRARPNEIVQFGGTKEFTPAYIISDQGGYSFSSGHVAAAFSLLGFALLAQRRKKFWMWLALTYGVGTGFARMCAGGHFFSDVVTSFFIVYIATHIFYKLIFKKDSSE